jgi:hypothetical protein
MLNMSIAAPITPDLQVLSQQVASLTQRVAGLEDRQVQVSPEDLERLLAVNQRVQDFTEAIFGAPATIEQSSDPETESVYFVVRTSTSLEVPEILKLNSDWHRRLHEPAGDMAHKYRLSLDIS